MPRCRLSAHPVLRRRRRFTRGGKTHEMDTSKIGANKGEDLVPWPEKDRDTIESEREEFPSGAVSAAAPCWAAERI